MISTTPFFIRAIYDWCIVNQLTPVLSFEMGKGVTGVPDELIHGNPPHGRGGVSIVDLSIEPAIAKSFTVDFHAVKFWATYKGLFTQVYIPMDAVRGISNSLTGVGIGFSPIQEDPPKMSGSSKSPILKRIK